MVTSIADSRTKFVSGARLAIIATIFAIVTVVGPGAQAQEVKLPLLAVYEPIIAASAKTEVARLKVDALELARQTEQGLRATRRFAVYERSQEVLQSSVLREQDFAQSGLAKGNAAGFGKLDNVQFIVQPEVTILGIASNFSPIEEFPGHYRRKDIGRLTVVFKLLDTTTGEIKFQTTQTVGFDRGAGTTEDKSHGVGGESFAALASEVSIKATNAIVNYVYPIQVVRAEHGDIFLNRGESGGLNVGDIWEIESAGEVLVDPTNNENLGSSETPLGRVRVIRIAPRFSVAQAIGKLTGEVKAGDVLRPLTSQSK
jgi:hypothetical protein